MRVTPDDLWAPAMLWRLLYGWALIGRDDDAEIWDEIGFVERIK